MDKTAEKLHEALEVLEHEQWRITNKIAAVKAALALAGVPAPVSAVAGENESEYVRCFSFAGKRLTDSCERIVKDHQGAWLDKGKVVYLLERGGYTSEARDLKNSVHCSLRQLALRGRIEVQKRRGALGNKYRFMPQGEEKPRPTEPAAEPQQG
jgi:hypothetical protein